MSRYGWTLCAVIVGVVMCVSNIGMAQEGGGEGEDGVESEAADDVDDPKARAEEIFAEGAMLYNTEEYRAARKQFLDAYKAYPAAIFLYNAARSSEQLGELDTALKQAKRARAEQRYPLPEKWRKRNSRLIGSLQTRISQREYERELEQARGLDWRGWSGVGAAGVGASAIVLGLGVFGRQAREGNEELATIRDQAEYQVRRDEVEADKTTAQVFLFSGLGLVAAGGGLVAWDLLDLPEKPRVIVAPSAGRGVQVQIRWMLGESR